MRFQEKGHHHRGEPGGEHDRGAPAVPREGNEDRGERSGQRGAVEHLRVGHAERPLVVEDAPERSQQRVWPFDRRSLFK
jgi:hypothetical protein